jgi:hypothetical protein
MRRLTSRKALLSAFFATAVAVPTAMAWPSLAAQIPDRAPRAVSVSSVQQLSTALAAAAPGDRITVAAGRYTTGTIRAARSGTKAKPITIAASKTGGTTIAGKAKFDLAGASNVVVQGFTLETGLDVPVSAKAVRVTRNTFQGNKSGSFLNVAGDDTEVDHNTFQNKTTEGVYLQVNGPGSNDIAKRVHIHQNFFFNHQFKGGNGGETIRFGLSSRQHGVAQGLVENNLLEKADGDSEAISIKASNVVVRNNTLFNSRGTISLRHGSGSTVEGNIVIGGSSGIRFFGNNHKVINNIVQDSTGLPMEVGGGEIKDDKNSTRDHEAADNCLVAFNTLVGNGGRVVKYGSDKKFAPSGVTLDDNIIVGKGGSAVTGNGGALYFAGNVLSGAAAGTMPANGFKAADPKLARGTGDLLRLGAGSAAIGAGTGAVDGVTKDIDGQDRGNAKDAGADEFNNATPVRPLTRADVGPDAP